MANFPDYEAPPVVEVVMGIQFPPIVGLTTAHVGLYWAEIREEFNRAQDQPPIPRRIEPPGAKEEGEDSPIFKQPQASFHVSHHPEWPRIWFESKSGTRLIQLQRDHFLFNWRKMSAGDEYPRYPALEEAFLREWAGFRAFLEGQDLPSPKADQLEVTYVNQIKKGEGWDATRDIVELFTNTRWKPRTGFLPEPEYLRWSFKFLLPAGAGRLHADIMVPVLIPPGNEKAVHFTLTARGRPQGEMDEAQIREWFALAREYIVKGFVDFVSEATDSLWGLKT